MTLAETSIVYILMVTIDLVEWRPHPGEFVYDTKESCEQVAKLLNYKSGRLGMEYLYRCVASQQKGNIYENYNR